MKFIIDPENQGSRLDKYLVERLPELSRSQLQKLIKDEQILVDQKVAKPHQYLELGATVEVYDTSLEKKIRPTESELFEKIVIIDETPEYLVLNKPAGLIVHPAESLQEAALTDWLIKKYPQVLGVGEDDTRPGIMHRLDKDVSGLMIVALTAEAYTHFKKLFQGRRLKKIYTALVHGVVKRDNGVIDFPIERSAGGYKMAAKPKNAEEGKPAESHFEVLRRFLHYTLVEVLIKTGRTHQIRAHLAAYSNPIIGDNLYGGHLNKLANKKFGTKRIYLAATKLEFKDPKGEKKSYQLEIPEEFTKLMSTLK